MVGDVDGELDGAMVGEVANVQKNIRFKGQILNTKLPKLQYREGVTPSTTFI